MKLGFKQATTATSVRTLLVGYTYDSQRDAFIPPQPYPSWTLVEETCNWTAPVLYPADGKMYQWDEATTNWIQVSEETP
jgi:hypothetical protein